MADQDSAEARASASAGDRTGLGRRRRRLEPLIAVVLGLLSLVVLVAVIVSRPAPRALNEAPPSSRSTERGDPVLGERLAAQADRPGQDPRTAVQLLLAAHVVAPDRVGYRLALARRLVMTTDARPMVSAPLDGFGTISSASINADASFVFVASNGRGSVWQAQFPGGPPRVRPVRMVNAVTGAAAGTVTRTVLLTTSTNGSVSAWRIASPEIMIATSQIEAPAQFVAVTPDGAVAATGDANGVTLWRIESVEPHAVAQLRQDRPITTIAFAPGSDPILVAGHVNGNVTVDHVDLASQRTSQQTWTSARGPIDAVAVNAEATTVLAVHEDGTVSLWTSTATAERSWSVGKGPHRVWVNARGEYAFVADASTASFWDLTADPPAPFGVLGLTTTAGVPAMVSSDARVVVTIDADRTLSLFDTSAVQKVIADPVDRACAQAALDEAAWRMMVPNPAFANPCTAHVVPSLEVHSESPR